MPSPHFGTPSLARAAQHLDSVYTVYGAHLLEARLFNVANTLGCNAVQEGKSLDDWLAVWRIVQGAEVWQTHGDWINKHNPDFGDDIQARFEAASQIAADDVLQKQRELAECAAAWPLCTIA